jgi:hypothetical protein
LQPQLAVVVVSRPQLARLKKPKKKWEQDFGETTESKTEQN